jgi:hypothetical protein
MAIRMLVFAHGRARRCGEAPGGSGVASAARPPRRGLTAILALAVAAAACQPPAPPVDVVVAPIPQAELAGIERVGVVSTEACRATDGNLPDVIEGAGEGALRGAGDGAMIGLAPLSLAEAGPIGLLIGAALCVVTVPLGVIVGTTVGAASAHSPEEVAAAEEAMRRALDDTDLVTALTSRIAETGNFRTLTAFVACDAVDPQASCPPLPPAAIGLVVELQQLHVSFLTPGKPGSARWSPDFTPFVVATAVVLTEPERRELFRGSWRYRGRLVDYFDMADAGAERFATELARAIEALGDAIVADAFVGPAKTLSSRPLPPMQQLPGSVALFQGSLTEVQTR